MIYWGYMQHKNIVILGAGFAGLRASLSLEKYIKKHPGYKIILVEERPVHLYTPDLYEIATAFHEKINEACLTKLKDAVAIPFSKILHGKAIEFLRDRVVQIFPKEKSVQLTQTGRISYEYLVVALGSVVNYYGIPGLEEYSYSLKTLTDGLAMNCHLDMRFHNLWKAEPELGRKEKREISIVVGGGGATGVEFASELPSCIDKLCRKYHYPRSRVVITIIEGSGELAGQGPKATKVILGRLNKLGIRVQLNTSIRKVDEAGIHLKSAGKGYFIFPNDFLIWTGGVKPHPLAHGGLQVNEFLMHPEFPEIFAAGDNAVFVDPKTKKPAPGLAQIAYRQGHCVAKNILADIEKRPKTAYEMKFSGVIIPVGGRYAVFKKGNLVLRGFWMWVLRRLVDLRYALGILPVRYAITKWIHNTNVFMEND